MNFFPTQISKTFGISMSPISGRITTHIIGDAARAHTSASSRQALEADGE
jgi:hypothetical protein